MRYDESAALAILAVFETTLSYPALQIPVDPGLAAAS